MTRLRPAAPAPRPAPRRRRWVAGLLCLLCAASAGAAQVSAPDTLVPRATSLRLPVRVSGLAGDGLVSFEVTVTYDRALLSLDSLAVGGTAAETWLLDTALAPGPVLDTLRVAAATAADTLLIDGALFDLALTAADERRPATADLDLLDLLLNAGTPAAVTAAGSVTLTGSDGSIATSPPSLLPGTTVQVFVDDADEDRSPAADAVTVRLALGADSEILSAVETVPGHFEATVDVVYSLGVTPGDGRLQGAAGQTLTACYDDSLDTAGATVERCAASEVTGGHNAVLTTTRVVQPGDTLWLRLADLDLNADDLSIDHAALSVSNTRTGEVESLSLPETAAATGVFFGHLRTQAGDGPGGDDDGVLLGRKGDALVAAYVDEVDVLGGPQERTGTTTAVDPFGDASGNGSVRGFDASLILEHSVGALTLTGLDSLSANLDLAAPAGPITAFDASLVLQQRVGLLGRFPVQSSSSANHPQPSASPRAAGPLAVDVRWVPVVDGWLLHVDSDGIRAGVVELAADALDDVDGEVLAGPGLPGALLASHRTGARTRVAFASATPAVGRQLLRLRTDHPAAVPAIVSARFDGGRLQGQVRPGPGPAPAVRAALVELLPAVPNPFNPTTVIPFDLARAGHVRLRVLNGLGQSVRSLQDGRLTAGRHAVIWDGRDDGGAGVAAGIYFLRLETPDGLAVGKLTLAK